MRKNIDKKNNFWKYNIMTKIKKFKEIKKYLEEYEDLWQKISMTECSLPCMDLAFNIIDEDNYYGFDFTDDKKVLMLFHTGQSNYFPAFCNIEITKSLDECPIYIFDAASDIHSEYIGNFKYYISVLLNEFINKNVNKKSIKEAKNALSELDKFSSKVEFQKYKVMRNFE